MIGKLGRNCVEAGAIKIPGSPTSTAPPAPAKVTLANCSERAPVLYVCFRCERALGGEDMGVLRDETWRSRNITESSSV